MNISLFEKNPSSVFPSLCNPGVGHFPWSPFPGTIRSHHSFVLFFLYYLNRLYPPSVSPSSFTKVTHSVLGASLFEFLSLYSKAGPSETDDVDEKLPLSKPLQGITFSLPFSRIPART